MVSDTVTVYGRKSDGTPVPLPIDDDGKLDTSGSGGGGGASTIANGADVNAGSTTDAAVDSDANGTLSAKLRGLVKIFADVWNNSENSLQVWMMNRLNLTDDQVGIGATTTGGATPYKLISAASTNATSVKGSAGTVYMITASNVNAAVRYLKLYNKATAPTVGTDTPVHTFAIPGNTAGAGTNIPVPAVGLNFSTGIAFALTTEATDAGTTGVAANELAVNLAYK